MFTTFFQPKESKYLYKFIANFRASSENMEQRAQAASQFGDGLLNLIQSEAPNYSIYFESIKKEYDLLSNAYKIAASQQKLAVENFNDIFIRFPIVQRKEQEKVKLIQQYNSINKKYKDIKKKYKAQQTPEIEATFKQLRNDRAKMAEQIIQKVEENEQYQQRFDRFVQNRSQTAWKIYSESIDHLCINEYEIMNRLKTYCYNFRDNIDHPEAILDKAISEIDTINAELKVESKLEETIPITTTQLTESDSTLQKPVIHSESSKTIQSEFLIGDDDMDANPLMEQIDVTGLESSTESSDKNEKSSDSEPLPNLTMDDIHHDFD